MGYDGPDFNATARFLEDLRSAAPLLGRALGGRWLVLGSWSPWVEAALLATGVAGEVTTLEQTRLRSCPDPHPLLHPVVPSDFAAQRGGPFDGFVQFSSVEHSGLGRYGDEINPWADRQTVAGLWCRAAAGAWFVFGPAPQGAPADAVYFNAGREYGREGLGRLMLNWELVRGAPGDWHSHLFRRVQPGPAPGGA